MDSENPETVAVDYTYYLLHPELFLQQYGWYMVFSGVLLAYFYTQIRSSVQDWLEKREDARHHKDEDLISRHEAMEQARQRQQEIWAQQSAVYIEQKKQKEEERKRQKLEELKKAASSSGSRLGTGEYLPLSGGGVSGGYRPPKKSKCGGGGCGR